MKDWMIEQEGFDPARERYYESVFSLGNGFMGMRGTLEEDYSGDTLEGMYLGGVWYPDKTRVGWWKNGYPAYFGKVINAPKAIGARIYVNGEALDLAKAVPTHFERALDMEKGVLSREMTVTVGGAAMTARFERFVSMAEKHLLFERITLSFACGAELRVVPYLDAHVKNEDSNYGETFWDYLKTSAAVDTPGFVVKTKENPFGTPRFTVAYAMACRAENDGAPVDGLPEDAREGYVGAIYAARVAKGGTFVIEKAVGVTTDRDEAAQGLLAHAERIAHAALEQGYQKALASHAAVWREKWDGADIVIEGDERAQQGIRFNLFELFSTYTGADARLNIGPKGFTGEKYGGATYWDTEAFCLPVYMAASGADVALNLLKYRRQQLDAAYQNAAKLGLKGALYPMVTFTGDECHNEWEITFEEIHRNAAIAYAIWNYTTFTGDKAYEKGEGFDVLLGIARFWASRAHFSKRAGKYMIHGVTGPNEYENNVNNNWYTNRMAAWCLTYCADVAQMCGEERLKEAGLEKGEPEQFRTVAENMYLPEDKALGIFVQHDTFLDKDIYPAAALPAKDRPLNQHWSWDRILRSCFIKQADVLQGMYFLGHLYDRETKKRNFDFYEPLTVHESSLSPSVHSVLAAELGEEEKAVEMYERTARLDLDDINHDTSDGLHITSMSGAWLAIVQGFAGMRTANGLSFAPFLPKRWTGYAFALRYRGRVLRVLVRGGRAQVRLEKGEPLSLMLCGRAYTVSEGAPAETAL